jgi:hypothetical protein
MVYEDHKNNDQIASDAGKRGLTHRHSRPCRLLVPLFTQRLYSTPVVCDTGLTDIFQDRLSWYRSTAARLAQPLQMSRTQTDTALLDPLLRRATAAKKRAFENLLRAVFVRARKLRLLKQLAQGAIDSTGLESRHTTRHYINRKGYKRFLRYHWPKVTVVCHTDTYLFASCIVSRGPSNDSPEFAPAVRQARQFVRFKRMLADAGYDGEHNHRLCREELSIKETVIALNKRRSRKWPRSPYRRLMKEHFPEKVYNQRWHVESAISQDKRILGSALRARSEQSRQRECLLRVLTHDLMIIRRAA